jgi:hypothetical protein
VKYALLIYPGTMREAMGRLSENEQRAIMAEYRALAQEPGVFSSEQLHPGDTATTVRVENGTNADNRRAVFDRGPRRPLPPRSRRLDHAIELAGRSPAARLGGTVEVRPIVER